jgi:quercetin dioxygenase-like cupin family protein
MVMERKEPYATQEELNKRVIHYRDVPAIEARPGSKSHIISTERITISFITLPPNISTPVHNHEHEQTMIIMDGACDTVIEGKTYHVEEGDVLLLPSNTKHGSHVSDRGCRIIDIFSPPRQDLVAKLEEVKKSQK